MSIKNKKGNIVAVMLLIVVILASFAILTTQYINTEETTLITKTHAEIAKDMQNILERAVRNWLTTGPAQHTLACNGQYNINKQQYENTLSNTIQQTLTEFSEKNNNILQVGTPTINITEEKIIIELKDTYTTYQEENIQSKSKFDTTYNININILTIINATQDWISCDKGNTTTKLEEAFGDCLWGRKDCSIAGNITTTEWETIHENNITQKTIQQEVDKTIRELEQYFRGKTCNGEPTNRETKNINCTYAITNTTINNNYLEYHSNKAPQEAENTLTTLNATQYTRYVYTDQERGCTNDIQRQPIPFTNTQAPYELTINQLQNTYPQANIEETENIYTGVASDKGAKFTVDVTCYDLEQYIQGEPISYTFTYQVGYRKICEVPALEEVSCEGPDYSSGGQCTGHLLCPDCEYLTSDGETLPELCVEYKMALYKSLISQEERDAILAGGYASVDEFINEVIDGTYPVSMLPHAQKWIDFAGHITRYNGQLNQNSGICTLYNVDEEEFADYFTDNFPGITAISIKREICGCSNGYLDVESLFTYDEMADACCSEVDCTSIEVARGLDHDNVHNHPAREALCIQNATCNPELDQTNRIYEWAQCEPTESRPAGEICPIQNCAVCMTQDEFLQQRGQSCDDILNDPRAQQRYAEEGCFVNGAYCRCLFEQTYCYVNITSECYCTSQGQGSGPGNSGSNQCVQGEFCYAGPTNSCYDMYCDNGHCNDKKAKTSPPPSCGGSSQCPGSCVGINCDYTASDNDDCSLTLSCNNGNAGETYERPGYCEQGTCLATNDPFDAFDDGGCTSDNTGTCDEDGQNCGN